MVLVIDESNHFKADIAMLTQNSGAAVNGSEPVGVHMVTIGGSVSACRVK